MELPNQDRGKILISGEGFYTGKELFDILRDEYDLELEMASGGYCLAMTSLMDTRDGFTRLLNAVFEIDDCAAAVKGKPSESSGDAEIKYPTPIVVLSMAEALEGEKKMRPLASAVNCVSAGFVSFYPPGIPVLAPGELITQQILNVIKEGLRRGLNINGLDEKGIIVVDS